MQHVLEFLSYIWARGFDFDVLDIESMYMHFGNEFN